MISQPCNNQSSSHQGNSRRNLLLSKTLNKMSQRLEPWKRHSWRTKLLYYRSCAVRNKIRIRTQSNLNQTTTWRNSIGQLNLIHRKNLTLNKNTMALNSCKYLKTMLQSLKRATIPVAWKLILKTFRISPIERKLRTYQLRSQRGG